MIEVIYKDESQEGRGNEKIFSVPRNIRQIGLIDRDCRIYVEDYVYTFLGRISQVRQAAGDGAGCVAVLTGSIKRAEGITYVFIKGALLAEGMEASAEHIGFTEEIWKKLNEEGKKYFPDQETVGWFLSQPGIPPEMTEAIKKAHLKHFGGGEKVMMLMDPAEREDAFFCYENGFMVKQNGYYVYYERNPLMQAYMLEKNNQIQPEKTEEVQDEAVRTFRKIINGKKKSGEKQSGERMPVFSYGAAACLIIAALAVGGSFYRNYRTARSINKEAGEAAAILDQTDAADESDREKQALQDTEPEDVFEVKTADEDGAEISVETSAAVDQLVKEATGEKTAVSGEETSGKSGEISEAGTSGDTEDTLAQETEGIIGERVPTETPYPKITSGPSDENSVDAAVTPSPALKTGNEWTETANEESDLRKAKTEQTSSQTKVRTSYVIRPGDTLYQISLEKYGDVETVKEICELNGFTEDEIIYPGQIIKLP